MGKKWVKPKPIDINRLSQEWTTVIINGLHIERIKHEGHSNCLDCNAKPNTFHRFGCWKEKVDHECLYFVDCKCGEE